MTAHLRRAQVCALVQIYMVAGSNRCPTLRAGGLRVDPWTSGSRIVARMADANKSSAAFPPFPGETPEAHEVKEWWRATQPHLTASQHALQNHQMPRELLDYTLATVPDALVSQNAGGTDGGGAPRPTCCSVPPPIGPLCDRAHAHPVVPMVRECERRRCFSMPPCS